MDRGSIRQIFAQIKTKLFLCAAADCDDDMSRAILLNERQEISVFNF
jgi:hypothetical protein